MFRLLISLAAIACAYPSPHSSAQITAVKLNSPEVKNRADALKAEFAHPPQDAHAIAARHEADRKTTVLALVAIAHDESARGGDRRLISYVLHELANYPESVEGIALLIEMIEFKESNVLGGSPIRRFPAAQSLIRIGLPARRYVMGVGKELSDENLQLRAYVLAALDKTEDDDPHSGQGVATFRLLRKLEGVEAENVLPQFEASKRMAIKNLQRMIALTADPALMAKNIPHAPPTLPNEN
jgi:hypothetical protein